MKEDKMLKALEKFRKEMDKIFVGKTPKLTGEMNEVYDCDIYIWRHPGMGNSKQIVTGNKISILTATASYLETLLRENIVTERELKELVKMSTDAAKGKLK